MSKVRLPRGPEELTADWLTAALRPRLPDIEVERLDIVEVIPGTATKIRVRVGYAGTPGARPPESLCIKGGFDQRWYRKGAGSVVKRLGLMDVARAYQLEAAFYHHIAPTMTATLPNCWFADADDSGQGIVILDDLVEAGVSFGDPTMPWSVDRVAAALEVQAAWHAATMGKPPSEFPWLPRKSIIGGLTPILFSAVHWNTHFRFPRAPSLPSPLDDRRVVRAAITRMWERHAREAICLTHGDAHVGNTYTAADGRPTFLDWQAVCLGPPLDDVAYFVTGALEPADRRASERELLGHYLRALAAHGGAAPGPNEAWRAYRCYSVHGLLWAVTPPMMQSRANVAAMTERHAAAIIDLDGLRAVSG
ncbi:MULTISPECIES: phosphotransferase [unclassified Mycobacterium]|uniref:phosphotransferase n=1 Tax=unclassified Mycobacterium TaxID=2642494 RepID=UPI0029C8882D|nr:MULTISPECIES: phosphotransferase [unclassified Mycobacterium]